MSQAQANAGPQAAAQKFRTRVFLRHLDIKTSNKLPAADNAQTNPGIPCPDLIPKQLGACGWAWPARTESRPLRTAPGTCRCPSSAAPLRAVPAHQGLAQTSFSCPSTACASQQGLQCLRPAHRALHLTRSCPSSAALLRNDTRSLLLFDNIGNCNGRRISAPAAGRSHD